MKHLLTIISCFVALNLTAQEVVIEYPYNPDSYHDFLIQGNGPNDYVFSDLGNHNGQYIRCIKD